MRHAQPTVLPVRGNVCGHKLFMKHQFYSFYNSVLLQIPAASGFLASGRLLCCYLRDPWSFYLLREQVKGSYSSHWNWPHPFLTAFPTLLKDILILLCGDTVGATFHLVFCGSLPQHPRRSKFEVKSQFTLLLLCNSTVKCHQCCKNILKTTCIYWDFWQPEVLNPLTNKM